MSNTNNHPPTPPRQPPPSSTTFHSPKSQGPYKPTVILHGGAGSITRATLPPDLYKSYHTSLLAYLTSTKTLLDTGSTAVEAACHAVTNFEDDPLFNCGHGSVFTSAGEIEMEASLAVASITSSLPASYNDEDGGLEYEGQIKRSAAVSMVTQTRHPILLAREVLNMADEDGGFGGTPEMHGHLSGRGVEEWGWNQRGLERMDKSWFWTERRWKEHLQGLGEDVGELQMEVHDLFSRSGDGSVLPSQGTVGAVCMDSWGVVAVATSTGGLTNKKPGRIGDTPTVGAGFWAESWNEDVEEDSGGVVDMTNADPLSSRLSGLARSGIDFWVGDCLSLGSGVGEGSSDRYVTPRGPSQNEIVEKQPLMCNHNQMNHKKPILSRRRAVAMSGTGNGDSFLRTNACRTAAAISRFSSKPLAEAITAVAGSDGELQKSAGERWNTTEEGEGGIIGIELVTGTENNGHEGSTAFDFNCGGLWRAYFDKDSEGNEQARIMVFREEY